MTLTTERAKATKRHSWSSKRWIFTAELVGTALVLLLPGLIANAFYLRLAQDVAILAILALGLTLIFGFTGQISLGQAAFYAVGGYASAIVQTQFGVPAPLAWVFAILLGMGAAYVISLPLLRIQGHFLALGTLALGLIVETMLVQFVDLTGGHDGIRLPSLTHLGEFMMARFPYVVAIFLVLAYWLVRNLTARSVGRSFLALRDDPNGAAALGIPVTRYKTMAFMIGGGLAAAAGVLYAHHTQVITPEVFGFNTSMQVLLVVVIGGMTSRFGAIIGAAIVVLVPEVLQFLQESENLIFGLLVLAALLYLPGGIVGGITSLIHWVQRIRTRKEVAA
jgi:branched-chain amino acid transport system permease protein